jgi:hypothetical protein
MYCWCGDWLCTHAGLSRTFFEHWTKDDPEKQDQVTITGFLDTMLSKNPNALFNCSSLRRGWDESSGIVWNDFDEFIDIPNIKQIFGHTHNTNVRKTENSYCIDAFMKKYGIYDTEKNEMTIGNSE